ncbi:hypothetical protein JCM11491_005202 [Sporobolomyces phaffii]
MWANLNLKSLQDKFQESLHDLESSLAAVAPPVPPAATAGSSQPSSPSTRRQQPPPVSTHQSPTRTNSGGIGLPLSPTSLSNAQQSASQLADSALSSLRASLRKGRQSFDAARASLDGGHPSVTSPTARRTTSMDSVTSLTDSIRERELDDKDRGKGKGKLEELKEREEAETDGSRSELVEVAPVVREQAPKPDKVEAVEEEQEDEDAWGVGVSHDLVDFSSPVETPLPSSPPASSLPVAVDSDPIIPGEDDTTPELSDPLASFPSISDEKSTLPSSPPKPLVNPILAKLQQESLEAKEDLTADTPRPSTMGIDPSDPAGDAVPGPQVAEAEEEEDDGWDLPEVEAEAENEDEEPSAPEPVVEEEDPVAEPKTREEEEDSAEQVHEEEQEAPITIAEPKKFLDPLSEPFQPSFTPPAPSSVAKDAEEIPVAVDEPPAAEPELAEIPLVTDEISPAQTLLAPDDVGPADYPEDIEDLVDTSLTSEPTPGQSGEPTPDEPLIPLDLPSTSHAHSSLPLTSINDEDPVPQPHAEVDAAMGLDAAEPVPTSEDPILPAPQGIELVEEQVLPVSSELPPASDEALAGEQAAVKGEEPVVAETTEVDDLLVEPEQPTVSQPETNSNPEKLILDEAEAVQEPEAIGVEADETVEPQSAEPEQDEAEEEVGERKPRVEGAREEYGTGEYQMAENRESEEAAVPVVVEEESPESEVPVPTTHEDIPATDPVAPSSDAQDTPAELQAVQEDTADRIDSDTNERSVPPVVTEPTDQIAHVEPVDGTTDTAATEPEVLNEADTPSLAAAQPPIETVTPAKETEVPGIADDHTAVPVEDNEPEPSTEPTSTTSEPEEPPVTSPPVEEAAPTVPPPVEETPASLPAEENEQTPTPATLAAVTALDSVQLPDEGAAATRARSVSVSQDSRFIELSAAHDRLQTLKTSLDSLLSDLIPSVSSVDDTEALGDELRNLKTKADMGMDEVRRMSGQLDQQKSRMEEVREMHRLEHQSQQSEIDALRDSLAARNASLDEANDKLAAAEKSAEATRREIVKAADEYDKLKIVAKEEEEKRVKALSLLRALRQKLVKNEQDKASNDQELEKSRKAEKDALDTLKSDRARFDKEIVALRTAHEAQLTKLRTGFEREAQGLKERFEKEAISKRGQFELDAIHVKATQAKEMSAKDTRISQLEAAVKDLTKSRDQVFEEAQKKTEEVEETKSHEAVLRGRTSELEYELKEARDRNAALAEELEEVKRAKRETHRDDSNARKLLAETEARYESRIRDLESRSRQLEKDRQETEEEMGRNMQDRLKEVERMRAALAQKDLDYAESVQNSQKRDAKIAEAEKAKSELEKRLQNVEEMLKSVKDDADKATHAEIAVREELGDRVQRAAELEARLEEVQTKESALRSNNKTLREELRKLQSGVLLSEKQRHPGVGYFSSFNSASSATLNGNSGSPEAVPANSRQVISPSGSVSSLASTATGGGLSGAARANGSADEALNFEYMRNVILQFLEKPEMRPHLISVLGVILHFTPAESRRLVAKAGH